MANLDFNFFNTEGRISLTELQDRLIAFERKVNYGYRNLDSLNVKRLYTNVTVIGSSDGHFTIDDEELIFEDESTRLRLRMGLSTDDVFRFEMFTTLVSTAYNSTDASIYLNSSGEAVFADTIFTGKDAVVGQNLYVGKNQTTDVKSIRLQAFSTGTNETQDLAFRTEFIAGGLLAGEMGMLHSTDASTDPMRKLEGFTINAFQGLFVEGAGISISGEGGGADITASTNLTVQSSEIFISAVEMILSVSSGIYVNVTTDGTDVGDVVLPSSQTFLGDTNSTSLVTVPNQNVVTIASSDRPIQMDYETGEAGGNGLFVKIKSTDSPVMFDDFNSTDKFMNIWESGQQAIYRVNTTQNWNVSTNTMVFSTFAALSYLVGDAEISDFVMRAKVDVGTGSTFVRGGFTFRFLDILNYNGLLSMSSATRFITVSSGAVNFVGLSGRPLTSNDTPVITASSQDITLTLNSTVEVAINTSVNINNTLQGLLTWVGVGNAAWDNFTVFQTTSTSIVKNLVMGVKSSNPLNIDFTTDKIFTVIENNIRIADLYQHGISENRLIQFDYTTQDNNVLLYRNSTQLNTAVLNDTTDALKLNYSSASSAITVNRNSTDILVLRDDFVNIQSTNRNMSMDYQVYDNFGTTKIEDEKIFANYNRAYERSLLVYDSFTTADTTSYTVTESGHTVFYNGQANNVRISTGHLENKIGTVLNITVDSSVSDIDNRVTLDSTGGVSPPGGLTVRLTDNLNFIFAANYFDNTTTLKLASVSSGITTILGEGRTLSTGDRMELIATSRKLQVVLNSSLEIIAFSSVHINATKHGLYSDNGLAKSILWDDWDIYNFPMQDRRVALVESISTDRRMAIDFTTHGAAKLFQNSTLACSLVQTVNSTRVIQMDFTTAQDNLVAWRNSTELNSIVLNNTTDAMKLAYSSASSAITVSQNSTTLFSITPNDYATATTTLKSTDLDPYTLTTELGDNFVKNFSTDSRLTIDYSTNLVPKIYQNGILVANAAKVQNSTRALTFDMTTEADEENLIVARNTTYTRAVVLGQTTDAVKLEVATITSTAATVLETTGTYLLVYRNSSFEGGLLLDT